jgi:hypothetical protein
MTEKAQQDGGDMPDFIELDIDGATPDGQPYRKKKIKKSIFPIGIFLMLFIILSIIAAGASFAYFMYAGKNGIAQIETYTRSYSPCRSIRHHGRDVLSRKKIFTPPHPVS